MQNYIESNNFEIVSDRDILQTGFDYQKPKLYPEKFLEPSLVLYWTKMVPISARIKEY